MIVWCTKDKDGQRTIWLTPPREYVEDYWSREDDDTLADDFTSKNVELLDAIFPHGLAKGEKSFAVCQILRLEPIERTI